MSKIYFIRHAKAVDENKDTPKDFARELSGKGKDDAKFMAARLKFYGVMPDVIFSSDAKRCEQTAKRFADTLKFKENITLVHKLYDINFEDFLKFVKNIKSKFREIFIISHNPATTQICEFLSDSSIDNIPTSGIFCIEFDCDLKDISEGCGRVVFFDHPKKHQN
ncbi:MULTISPECIES: SixA phosphatase family protein [Campylobacter]|uniref:SixA phosphatase family protein n=1 Tax=Campylobacter TaxID=194 RepID=UPI00147085C9|nr:MULTISPECIES: histidine phosphatase family protein [Campylobacter]MBN7288983.1 histidine phosphatase family protein [Campylobacter curvus]MDU6827219.1 histidine phosphatase family protein [Campylobacter sp.]